LTVARWYKKQGSTGRSLSSVVDVEVDLRTEDLEQRAKADRAREPRRAASRSTPSRADRETKRAREEWAAAPRRRAVPHGVTNPRLLEVAPVSLDGLSALRKRHAEAFDELADELRRQRYHEHPEEACRAVRTLAVRETTTPKILLRHLFKRARDGDPLVDGPEFDRIADAQEAAARANYAWDAEDPATHWADPLPDSTAGPPAPEPEDPARALVRKRLEAEREHQLRRREGERIVSLLLGATLRHQSSDARFLNTLAPSTKAAIAHLIGAL